MFHYQLNLNLQLFYFLQYLIFFTSPFFPQEKNIVSLGLALVCFIISNKEFSEKNFPIGPFALILSPFSIVK